MLATPGAGRPWARVERCVRWGCRHARENTGIYRSVTGVRGRKTLGAPFRRKQNKTKQENTDRVERTFRSAPVGTGVTEWYRKGSDRRDGGCAWFSPHPHGRASTARPLYGGRGAAILPVRACVPPRKCVNEREGERWGGRADEVGLWSISP